ncbi:MAG: carbonic anhydrase [Burkholderiales bacterium]|nr:carbonic anhydrase [Phycisphaerae bacterium]
MHSLIVAAVFASAGIAIAEEHHVPAHVVPVAASVPVPVPAVIPAAPTKALPPTADEVIETLRDGNRRFTSGDAVHPRADQDRRSQTYSDGQNPIVSLLSCADSRVPPELIFDAGIGDLFVIRIAGNVADTDEIATIEYGVGHLHTPLVVVMGHTKCGAVGAIVDGADLHGHLAALTDNIRPAAARVREENPTLKGQSLINKVVRANVFQSIEDLVANSAEMRTLIEKKQVKVVGAVYDINSGFIDWLGEHPRQKEILSAPPKPVPATHAGRNTHAKPQKPDSHTAPTPAKDGHSAVTPQTSAGPLKKYGPFAAFAVGSLALSAVVLHLVRK